MTEGRVLATGGSGFIAGHIIVQLLEQSARPSARSPARRRSGQLWKGAGMVRGDGLTFVAADLNDDAGWPEAVAGTDYVLHAASPIHTGKVKDENEVVAPARDGALRVLRAARDAGVKRVVLTSAFHSVGFGHGKIDHGFLAMPGQSTNRTGCAVATPSRDR